MDNDRNREAWGGDRAKTGLIRGVASVDPYLYLGLAFHTLDCRGNVYLIRIVDPLFHKLLVQRLVSQGVVGAEFFKSDLAASTDKGSVLVVFYSRDLEATRARVEKAGGVITKAIFSFPGGRRFHFAEPNGNELAVWSDP